ncbi:MAG: bifunctional DNA-formamidopyrimidine glycosylase/DNA-(apurinic or apyrimidinic site) lyase, partial [Candidatus Eremiobacteraeota bacterium]|nr:bifunctional DNA-formamidopyrimidine glycosylase/DNA-(apurinic or apyrimidinic site) lyase [Candidatus Eremiobacteraeota bacterium]
GRRLAGEVVAGVGRRGKYVLVTLSSGRRLVISLRMTGRLIVQPPPAEHYPYTNVVVNFTDGSRLLFADVRQFGRLRLVDGREPWDAELGAEPLSEEFTIAHLSGLLRGRTTPIKIFLLDQRRIAGIGNIYACEALWEAGIRPGTPARRISPARVARLHAAIQRVLRKAIVMRGTSVDDYVDAEGMAGGFQNELAVYGRAGEPCVRCRRPLVRTVIGQRGTWWCRACQR